MIKEWSIKPFVVTLLILASQQSARGAVFSPDYTFDLSAGTYISCAIDEEGVKCWGDHSEGQSNVPFLQHPKMVSAGYAHACALDDQGVKCWGSRNPVLINVPTLKNPKMVSSGGLYSCAIDDTGLKCWGSFPSEWKIPPLKKPIAVSANFFHACVIDGEEVKCWGEGRVGKYPASFVHPRAVSTGYSIACGLGDEGVKCWREYADHKPQPPLRNPTMVSAGGYHACALDDDGVKCWGNGENGEMDVPPLFHPRWVSAGNGYTCVLDDEGVKCWGRNDKGQATAIPLKTFMPAFHLDHLSLYLRYLSQTSTPARARYFKTVREFTEKKLENPEHSRAISEARYLALGLVSPAVLTMASEHYEQKVIPAFRESLASVNQELGYRDLEDGIAQIFDNSLNRTVALVSLKASLLTAGDFLDLSARLELQNSLRLVGQCLLAPMDKNLFNSLLAEMTRMRPILGKFLIDPKSRFLRQQIELAADWLKERAK